MRIMKPNYPRLFAFLALEIFVLAFSSASCNQAAIPSPAVDGQSRVVCPAFPSSPTPEPAGILQMPCGPTACPNKQLVATEHGMSVHMLF
jgi:hypothetical protein